MLKRLTEIQKDTFLLIVSEPNYSLRGWAGKLGISHISLMDRLFLMEKKHYVYREKGRWHVTPDGIDQVMTDGIHNRFIRSKK